MVINTLFLIVVLIFMAFIILGYVRGLFKSVFKLLAGVLAMALSYLLAPLVGSIIINFTTIDDYISSAIQTKIEATVREQVETNVKQKLESTTGLPISSVDTSLVENAVSEAMNTELTRNQQIEVINNISVPEFVKNALIENNQDSVKNSMGVSGFYEYIATYISYMVVNALSFAVTGMLINIILSVISTILSSAVRVPIIGNINRIGGMLFGFTEALIVVWIIFTVAALCMSTAEGAAMYSQITENQLLSFINDKNIINNIIAGIIKISV